MKRTNHRPFHLHKAGVRRRQTARRTSSESAFTLVEIMIAITIFGVVLIAIYSSWSAILRGSRAGLSAAAEAQHSRMALRAIEEALGSVQMFTGNIKHYAFWADTSGDFAEMSFVARLPASFPGSGMFGEQVVRRVEFRVESAPGVPNQLVLRQRPVLEPEDRNTQPYTIVLAPNVSRFQVEFLDTNKFEWVTEWAYTNRIPKVVRVALGFGHKGQTRASHDDVAIQTVFLSSAAIPRELQVSGLRGFGGVAPGGMPPAGSRQALPGDLPNQNGVLRPPGTPNAPKLR